MSLHYLPDISLNSIEDLVYNANTASLYDELNIQEYERIGLDRAYYILSDMMTNYGSVSGYSILDVGCNNGLFSDLFSCYGNSVIGIDNFAIDRQNKYDALAFSANLLANFKQTDIDEFIATTTESFDFILLLSVAHQWEFGYAHTGDFKKDDEKICYIISSLFNRTSKAIYYECPMDEPGFQPGYGVDFLSRYLNQYEDASIVKVSDTIASNGYIRSLYRITHAAPKATQISSEEIAYNQLVELQKKYCIDGEIVANGSSARTKYAIYTGTSLIVPMRGNERDYSHPWGCQKLPDVPFVWWEKIKNNQPQHVVKIEKLYDEGYAQIEIVPGLPCMITPQIPQWQQKRYNNSERDFRLSLAVLAGMCNGLSELHILGIAHGDPYPYNAIYYHKENVKWVDLGNLSYDDAEIGKDICIFFLYTFPYILFRYGKISYYMIEKLDSEMSQNKNVKLAMKKAAIIFSESYSDEKDLNVQDIPLIFRCINHIIERYNASELNYLLYYQAYKYHLDMVTWMNTSNTYLESAKFIGLANQFAQLENIRSRLSTDFHVSEISNYKQQIAILQDKIIEQNKNLRSHLETINQFHDEITALHDKIIKQNEYLQDYLTTINQLNEEMNKQKIKYTHREAELQQTIASLENDSNDMHKTIMFQKKHINLLTDMINQYEKILQV